MYVGLGDAMTNIVLCKDCKHYNLEYHYCELLSEEPAAYSPGHIVDVYENDYCTYGESKEN